MQSPNSFADGNLFAPPPLFAPWGGGDSLERVREKATLFMFYFFNFFRTLS